MEITFRKEIKNNETKHSPPVCFHSNTQTVINDLDINNIFEILYQMILSGVPKWIGKCSVWLIESIDGNFINIL